MTTDPAGPVYPNREHQNADRAAHRRAHAALNGIEAEVRALRQRLEAADNPLSILDGDDTQLIVSRVRDLTAELAIIGMLRDVREWDKADKADKAGHWEPAPGCAVTHQYGAEGWRPGSGYLHEHWVPDEGV